MKVFLYTAGDVESHKELGRELAKLKPGEYVITVKKKKHIRSLDQNAYYWAILTVIANETGEYDRDRLHEICKKKFNGELIKLPKSGTELVGNSTSDLDTAEFTAYITRVKMWARDEFGITIQEQKDTTYKEWSEIENNYNQTFSGW